MKEGDRGASEEVSVVHNAASGPTLRLIRGLARGPRAKPENRTDIGRT
jgi:hypothetical protein